MGRTYGDRADGSDKVFLLKKRIKFLEREVARLTKELNKALQFVAEARNKLREDEEVKPHKKAQKGSACDQCGKGSFSEVFKIKIRNQEKVYLTCDTCGYRKSIK